jgi:hypothetical protein
MLPGISITLWRPRRLSSMHPAPTVPHRSVSAWLPAPPRVRSASRAQMNYWPLGALQPVTKMMPLGGDDAKLQRAT